VAIEVAVLELDARALRRLGDEAHLDLARLLGVRLDLPARVAPSRGSNTRSAVISDRAPSTAVMPTTVTAAGADGEQ